MNTILATGAAGFIGFHLCRRLIGRGDRVVGIDNLNDYYCVILKTARLHQLAENSTFRFLKPDIAEGAGMTGLFARERFDIVLNLPAQAGCATLSSTRLPTERATSWAF